MPVQSRYSRHKSHLVLNKNKDFPLEAEYENDNGDNNGDVHEKWDKFDDDDIDDDNHDNDSDDDNEDDYDDDDDGDGDCDDHNFLVMMVIMVTSRRIHFGRWALSASVSLNDKK